MHDIHSMDNSSELGRLFTGDGDRRLRPPNHDIKCPRCDSLNTKFCYYNNYNLSQPRHFCKNCRRYWTKGGVLRNVPVGGGVRKTKRSNKSKPTANNAHNSSHSENSSSESSSLTANTTTTTTATTTIATTTTNTKFINFSESSTQLANFELLTEGNIISKKVGENIDMFRLNHQNEVQWSDHTPRFNNHCENDQGLFDLTGTIDDQSYWSQSQWNDDNHHQLNYLP